MTTLVQGIISSDCDAAKHYIYSDNMVCPGIVSTQFTTSGTTLTIGTGEINAQVTDADGTDFIAKVVVTTAETISIFANTNLYVVIPEANISNPANNSDVSDVAYFVSATTAPETYATLIGTINSGLNVTPITSGHFVPGCDFCIRCEDGVLQLPDVNTGEITSEDISVNGNISTTGDITVGDDLIVTDDTSIGGDLNVSGVISGDGSGLYNVPTAGISYATETTPGLVRNATNAEVNSMTNTTDYLTPSDIPLFLVVSASDAGIVSFDDATTSSTTDVKLREAVFKLGGTYRISAHVRGDSGGGFAVCTVKVNGVTVHTYSDSTNLGTDFSVDKTINAGDTIEFWGRDDGDTCFLTKMAIGGTLVPYNITL